MITAPELPPKAGYVEVEIDGVRQYAKVETEDDENFLQLQLAVAELAENQAALDLENKLAIAELAEATLGGET